MKEAKSSNLNVRLDGRMLARLEALELGVIRTRTDIVRRSLESILAIYDETGSLEFPLQLKGADRPARQIAPNRADLAAQIMAGYAANPESCQEDSHEQRAMRALRDADALIAALQIVPTEKEEPPIAPTTGGSK